MLSLTYNRSFAINGSLKRVDELRSKILLTPLSVQAELRLKFNALTSRTYASLSLSEYELTHAQVLKLLSTQNLKKFNKQEQEVLDYKRAMEYIYFEWLANPEKVTISTLLTLHDYIGNGKLKAEPAQIEQLLEYLQVESEHPVIQAGIVYLQVVAGNFFTDGNARLARLLAYLFLYKAGYDFRGFLALEKSWQLDQTRFKTSLEQARNSQNMTQWLEYFTQSVSQSLEGVVDSINAELAGRSHTSNPLFQLNARQKLILSAVDEPNSHITNKQVQQMFKISQITASRDLTQLATLGLLTPHGKGRSVSYSKSGL